MAFKNFNGTLKSFPLAHLPTLALSIGTFSFWLELYVVRLPFGHTSWLAWGILILCLFMLLTSRGWQLYLKQAVALLCHESLFLKVIAATAFFLGLVYLSVGLYASLLPPHLLQESDALTYHITLPRQHLLIHSFTHLTWSVPDLFLLPIDYALSPFELATTWPNKLIQFVFFAGCLGVVFHLVYILSGQVLHRAAMGVVAVMACHAVAIQVGLAMLDLVMLYCFLAFIDSFLAKRWGLAAIEFAFFFWSKSFIPPQMMVIGAILGMVLYWALKTGFSWQELPIPDSRARKILLAFFTVTSLAIALPHLIKAFYYTGTPLYPLGTGFYAPLMKYTPDHWQVLLQRAADCMSEKDSYGHGRSLLAFIKHFWLIAVPERGVNNAFDYPVGLVYLLVLVPWGGLVIKSLKYRKLPILSLIIVIWWLTWWFGSQQSRFLLVPITLMIILTISYLPKISWVLTVLVIVSLGLEVISLVDAHRHDWGKPLIKVIREKDRKLLELKPFQGKTELELNFEDVAFSQFPVTVHQDNSVYVLPK